MFIAVLICIKKDSRGLIDATLERMAKTSLYAQTPLHVVHPTIMVYLHSKSVLFIRLVKYLCSFKLTLSYHG